MYDWITSILSSTNKKGNADKYGLQMSLTLSTHPLLEKYREDIRAENQKEPYFKKYYSEYLKYKCDIPKGRQDFPTIIVKGNQSSDIVYLMLPTNILEYLNDTLGKLKEALIDESYYGRSVYVKDSKYKEVDRSLFKPFRFELHATITVIENPVLF